jgi:hypothetical protein
MTTTRKPPVRVIMFKQRFAELVKRHKKEQTVRPTPKRMPKAGCTLSLREWTGAPYRSKQRVLREAVLTWVSPVTMDFSDIPKVVLSGRQLDQDSVEAFARLDGFNTSLDMKEWFLENHKCNRFEGVVYYW